MTMIYVAVIDYRIDGVDLYIASSPEDLDRQTADYCRAWWEMKNLDGDPPEDNKECIDAYFGEVQDEYLHTFDHETDLFIVNPNPKPEEKGRSIFS